jgi:cytochrome c biogenesis protein CcdA
MIYLWAYLAGILTLINPCVLPLLPVTIAAAFQAHRAGPLVLTAGLVSAFMVVGFGITAFGHLVGLDETIVNRIAAGLMIAFGMVLLLPAAQHLAARAASPLASRANLRISRSGGTGLRAQFFIGVLLGAVWSPCVGPTLGGAIGLALRGENLLHSAVTMLVFSLGVSSVLLALAYGSREVVGRRRARLAALMPYAKPLFGVILLVLGVAILLHWDRALESWLLDVMPVWLQELSVAL